MSRLLDALRNLQQSSEGSEAPPRKVTPRLAASIRKAVLGSDAMSGGASPLADAPVLFHVPNAPDQTESVRGDDQAEPDLDQLVESIQASIDVVQAESSPVIETELPLPVAPKESILEELLCADDPEPEPLPLSAEVSATSPGADVADIPVVVAVAIDHVVPPQVPIPPGEPEQALSSDSASHVEATEIESPPASESAASCESACSSQPVTETFTKLPAVVQPTIEPEPAPTPLQQSPKLAVLAEQSPPVRSRPQPTPAEMELSAILDDREMGLQFRDLLSAVERDVAGIALPIVAIVGLEERDATARVAAALGALWSAGGKSTLLIEANPQHDLAKRFGLPHARGLCEALSARVNPRDSVAATSRELLDLLPLGRATAAQDVAWTASLLNQLRGNPSHYDAIVVDVGPLPSPWAIALSQLASAVYLVVSLGDVSAEFATASVERFRSAGGQLKGCIAVDRE